VGSPDLIDDEIVDWNVIALVVKVFLPHWMTLTPATRSPRRKMKPTKTQMVFVWFGIKSFS